MPFSTDSDLLAIEPSIFEDIPFAAQQHLDSNDGIISGNTLSSASSNFVDAQIDQGGVLLIDGIPHEVIERVDTHTLSISLPRASTEGPAIPSQDASGLQIQARTFAPQAAIIYTGLLRLIGIGSDHPGSDLDASTILNPAPLAHAETLGTLELIYSGAASLTGNNDTLLMKAGEYRRRFRTACNSTTVYLDTDNDGEPNHSIHLGSVRMSRI